MRRVVKPGLVALAFALALALAPGAARAAVPEKDFAASMKLHHGRYEVTVGNLGQTVYLEAAVKRKGALAPTASAVYLAHGTATESRLRASFGELGEVSMRFKPSSNRTWVKPGRDCRGRGRSLTRRGTWVGTLRFPGEERYLGLDAHRAAGSVETVAPQCRQQSPRHDRRLIAPSQESFLGPEVPVLEASWRHGVGAATFFAGADEASSYFVAQTEEVHGPVAIFRSARAEAPPKKFSADDAMTAAHFAPPSPFHGSGSYRAAADGSRTWTGGLFVSFPGAPHYVLTAAPFEPTLKLLPELVVSLIGLFAHRERSPRLCREPTPGPEPGPLHCEWLVRAKPGHF